MNKDSAYMLKAIELAKKGSIYAKPNPMVGCVIVHNDEIIGSGYHERYGEAHAEVKAFESVTDKSLLPNSTFYVSLEPCAHHGKTGPCAVLLANCKPKRVVIAMQDPFAKVNGLGIQILEKSGIQVDVGIEMEAAYDLNPSFISFHEKKRPYIALKWAETADGFIAPLDQEPGKMHWISAEDTWPISHQWRAETMAILSGYQSIVKDNSSLNVRHVEGDDPLRIIWDKYLSLDADYKVFKDDNYRVFSEKKAFHNSWMYNPKEDALKQLMQYCFDSGIQSLLVEGGAKTHQKFLDAELADEIRIFRSKNSLEQGIKAAKIPSIYTLSDATELDKDQLLIYKKK